MTIMDLIRKISEKKSISRQKFKEMQEDQRLQKMLEERNKSSNQRELESYLEKQRQAQIKEQLNKIHKKQTKDMWKSNNLGGKATILKDNKKLLSGNKSLVSKNIFLDNKLNNPMTEEKLFFKW